ncbi:MULTISPECIES: MerR family transcriptional regulator [Gordonia]|uniref:DNA polymerase III subunit beta family protein n=1 Tax=Gordonia TaxID=2053 RepID=UPI0030184E7A
MDDSELMAIGAFARRTGLTASALRFYADAGLLVPARTDPSSGYRFYALEQVDRARLVRRLRDVDMPLSAVADVLDAGPEHAARLVDDHIDHVVNAARAAAAYAEEIKADLGHHVRQTSSMALTVNGPVTAAAIDQVLTAAASDGLLRALAGVRFDAESTGVTITATDRYRLATRTLPTLDPTAVEWSVTVDGDDLRLCLADLRRSPRAHIEVGPRDMRITSKGGIDRRCRLIDEPFPDHRAMLDALPAVTTRVAVGTSAIRRALETTSADVVAVRVGRAGVELGGSGNTTTIDATVDGDPTDVWFELRTLYPAVSSAIGADVLIDLRGPDMPATIRSADGGDLTALVMPTRPPVDGSTHPD